MNDQIWKTTDHCGQFLNQSKAEVRKSCEYAFHNTVLSQSSSALLSSLYGYPIQFSAIIPELSTVPITSPL